MVAFIVWHRRRSPQTAEGAASSLRADQNIDPYTGKPELDDGPAVKPYIKQELDTDSEVRSGNLDTPAELLVLETPKIPVAELAAANCIPDLT